jgi:putative membrane protein
MLELLAHLIITAALLLLVANIVKGIQIDGWGSAFLAAIVLGVVNALIRPLMILLTIPITIITFGLFLFVINALMLWLASALAPGFRIQSFGAAMLGSLMLTLLNILISALFGITEL